MKKTKIILGLSLIINIVLGYFIIQNNKSVSQRDEVIGYISMPHKLADISDEKVFREIFKEKNDSVYRLYFGNTFESDPVQSFLLACTYYMMKRNEMSIHDIEVIKSELKGRYGYSPEIDIK